MRTSNQNPLLDKDAFEDSVNDELKLLDSALNIYNNDGLTKMLQSEEQLRVTKSSDIAFAQPILVKDDLAVIFPNSINIVQGKSGVHKSRLAEIISSAFLKTSEAKSNLLGFRRNSVDSITLAYIDTERNLSDQLPAALQKILILAGYVRKDDPPNFRYASLIKISRSERLGSLKAYLELLRETVTGHVVVVLDVLSDCVKDFNSSSETLEILDMLNDMMNEWNVTFICVIHENPGSSNKARGHLGTELDNKATTTIQVSIDDQKPDLVKVSFRKCRSTRKHNDFYVTYCDQEHTLVPADEEVVRESERSKQRKANIYNVRETIKIILQKVGQIHKTELIESLVTTYQAGERTIEERLKDLIKDAVPIVATVNGLTQTCRLHQFTVGKKAMLRLEPISEL